MKTPAKKALFGAAYGIVLLAFSTIIGGGGHGIYIPFVISEAPLPFAAGFPMSLSVGIVSTYVLLEPPLLWAGISVLSQASRRWIYPLAVALHYVFVAIYVVDYWKDEFNDSYRNGAQIIREEAPHLLAFAAIYITGQFWLWRNFVQYSPDERSSAAWCGDNHRHSPCRSHPDRASTIDEPQPQGPAPHSIK